MSWGMSSGTHAIILLFPPPAQLSSYDTSCQHNMYLRMLVVDLCRGEAFPAFMGLDRDTKFIGLLLTIKVST